MKILSELGVKESPKPTNEYLQKKSVVNITFNDERLNVLPLR